MNIVFYISAAVALVSTAMVVTRSNAVHALLYLIVSLLSVAMVFFTFGAPFVAALEVIVYAGSIMGLFVFVVMMLNVTSSQSQERQWLRRRVWIGPVVLASILAIEMVYILVNQSDSTSPVGIVSSKQVGIALFGSYLLAVELASFVLLSGLVSALHLGRRQPMGDQEHVRGETIENSVNSPGRDRSN